MTKKMLASKSKSKKAITNKQIALNIKKQKEKKLICTTPQKAYVRADKVTGEFNIRDIYLDGERKTEKLAKGEKWQKVNIVK